MLTRALPRCPLRCVVFDREALLNCVGLCEIRPTRSRISRRLQSTSSSSSSSSSHSSLSASLSRPLSPIAHISPSHVDRPVSVAGWLVSIRRISKNLVFAVLLLPSGRGRLQVVAREAQRDVAECWERAGLHGAVQVNGILRSRPQEAQRQGKDPSDQLANFELEASETTILNAVQSGSLAFDPTDEVTPAREEVKAKHRYLDLRSTRLGHNLRLRSKVAWTVREYLHNQDFTEIETPILLRSTPEGAREYLVPARQASSSAPFAEPRFYALQQSPQQPKQLLIASGVTDRYFQLARCFRDEDGRKDRQPEFTQIDLEMGFVSGCTTTEVQEAQGQTGWQIGAVEVRNVIEGLIHKIWQVARPEQAAALPRQFPVMGYDEAMSRYGSDKPDVRSGVELYDLTTALKGSWDKSEMDHASDEGNLDTIQNTGVELLALTIPSGVLSNKEIQQLAKASSPAIECFRAKQGEPNSTASLLLRKSTHVRDFLNDREIEPTQVGAVGLARAVENAIEVGQCRRSPGASSEEGKKNADAEEVTHLFVATRKHPFAGGSTSLGDLRNALLLHLRRAGHLPQQDDDRFLWITQFPLFTRSDGDKEHLAQGRWSSTHHPFTAPVEADLDRLQAVLQNHSPLQHGELGRRSGHEAFDKVLAECKGQHYDLVLNGVEVGGGSVRIHSAQLQRLVFQSALQLREAEMAQFNHLLQALQSGAPPHAGIALGFDRLMAILCDTHTIRDVIAFPKSATGADPLFGSPAALVPTVVDEAEISGTTKSDKEHVTAEGRYEDSVLSQYGLQRRQK